MKTTTPAPEIPPVSLRISPSLSERIEQGRKNTGLSKAALLRLSVERGLPLVLKRLQSEPAKAA